MADRPDDPGSPPGLPRWVKLAAVTGAALVLIVLAALFIDGADHGPSRHTPQTEPAEIDAPGEHEPPDGSHG